MDIDGFVQNYLKCRILYETFAENDPNKIGFTGDGRAPLKIKRDGQALSVVFPFKTIVLDRYLLRPEEHTHRRFTLGPRSRTSDIHAYQSGERRLFSPHPRQGTDILAAGNAGDIQHQRMAGKYLFRLPADAEVGHVRNTEKVQRRKTAAGLGETVFHPREKVILQKMADALEVSYTALVIRLRGLGLLNHHDISEYIEKELQLGGNTS